MRQKTLSPGLLKELVAHPGTYFGSNGFFLGLWRSGAFVVPWRHHFTVALNISTILPVVPGFVLLTCFNLGVMSFPGVYVFLFARKKTSHSIHKKQKLELSR